MQHYELLNYILSHNIHTYFMRYTTRWYDAIDSIPCTYATHRKGNMTSIMWRHQHDMCSAAKHFTALLWCIVWNECCSIDTYVQLDSRCKIERESQRKFGMSHVSRFCQITYIMYACGMYVFTPSLVGNLLPSVFPIRVYIAHVAPLYFPYTISGGKEQESKFMTTSLFCM